MSWLTRTLLTSQNVCLLLSLRVTWEKMFPPSASWSFWCQRGGSKRACGPTMSWMWSSSTLQVIWTCSPALRTCSPGKCTFTIQCVCTSLNLTPTLSGSLRVKNLSDHHFHCESKYQKGIQSYFFRWIISIVADFLYVSVMHWLWCHWIHTCWFACYIHVLYSDRSFTSVTLIYEKMSHSFSFECVTNPF